MSGALCTFDASCQYFALVTSDGRLKLWDVASGALHQQYAEKNHLEQNYTCMAWSKVQHGTQSSTSSLGLIALGTESGAITIWDLTQGKVVHKLGKSGNGHTSSVNDVAFSSTGNTLFSSSNQKQVFEWNVQSGEITRTLKGDKQGVKRLVVSPDDETLATASSSVKLRDLSSMSGSAKLRTFTGGHSSSVNSLSFSPDGRWLLSGATGQRFLSLFDCDEEGEGWGEKGMAPASKSFSMDGSPAGLSMCVDEVAASLYVAATTDAGGVCLWRHQLNEKKQALGTATAPSTADGRVVLKGSGSTGQGPQVLRAQFSPSASHLILARGTEASPNFEAVKYRYSEEEEDEEEEDDEEEEEGEQGDIRARIEVEKVKKGSLLVGGAGGVVGKKRKGGEGATVVGSADLGAVHRMGATAEEEEEEARRGKKQKTGDEDSESEEEEEEDEDDEEEEEDEEMPLAERVKALTRTLDGEIQAARTSRAQEEVAAAEAAEASVVALSKKRGGGKSGALAAAVAAAGAITGGSSGAAGAAPSSASLVSLLEQALQARDDSLLEYCLQTSDPAVIENTVARLSPVRVLPFLQRVVDKFEKRPARALVLVHWIRCIVSTHTSFLIAQPDLVDSLAALYHTVQQRVDVFPKLMRLQGRLELVLSQISRRARNNDQTTQEGGAGAAPQRVFNDGETSDEEEEDDEEEEEGDEEEDDEEEDDEEEEDMESED